MDAIHLLTNRHESAHAVAAYMLFGPDAVGRMARHVDGSGIVHLQDLPADRSAALNAADLAVVMLMPNASSGSPASEHDEYNAEFICADAAYRVTFALTLPKDIPEREAWVAGWLNQVRRRTVELAGDERYRYIWKVCEETLWHTPEMNYHVVRPMLIAADEEFSRKANRALHRELRHPVPKPAPRSDEDIRRDISLLAND